jgi:histidinol phosphatase-like PHP family hydrolase
MSKMKHFLIINLILLINLINPGFAQLVREEMNIPDIPGYLTLKGDFHIHTVFSDGSVWPTIRVNDAWMRGYDAISITDHIEYQPKKRYIPINHNAGYHIAKPEGDKHDLIVIQGTEITRVMPPGHLNAIFIEDASKIETERVHHRHTHPTPGNYMDSVDHHHQDYMHALEEAINQGGFLFWNHPGWAAQAPDGIKMYDIHKELIEKGWLKGIEVANWNEWYPEAFQWCLDYNLAMISNSDVHQTEEIYEKSTDNLSRPVTLLFAKERTAESIREALDNARTAVWFNNLVMGRKEHVEPLFWGSVDLSEPFYTEFKGKTYANFRNTSDFRIEMEDVKSGETIKLLPQSTVIVGFEDKVSARSFKITNFLVEPEKPLEITLEIK